MMNTYEYVYGHNKRFTILRQNTFTLFFFYFMIILYFRRYIIIILVCQYMKSFNKYKLKKLKEIFVYYNEYFIRFEEIIDIINTYTELMSRSFSV